MKILGLIMAVMAVLAGCSTEPTIEDALYGVCLRDFEEKTEEFTERDVQECVGYMYFALFEEENGEAVLQYTKTKAGSDDVFQSWIEEPGHQNIRYALIDILQIARLISTEKEKPTIDKLIERFDF